MDKKKTSDLRMIAWELTRSCNLACVHCRASSKKGPYPGELTTEECYKVIDDIVSFSNPVIILTGGEPLLREDIFDIIAYGKSKGLTMVMAPNGTLLNEEIVKKIIDSGIKRISISLDGADEESHDNFRQVKGAFKQAIRGIEYAKRAGLEFQINSTITKRNIHAIANIIVLAKKLGAAAYHVFLLVPTGRGKEMEKEELSPEEYENTLKLLSQYKKDNSIDIKVTCAPHFNRIMLQDNPSAAAALRGRGCMGGVSFCFISHVGELQPCGYLELKCGNVRKLGFKKTWQTSEVFNNLRDFAKFKGKCGVCEFRMVCGGCRARAYDKYADYLREEPFCVYSPKVKHNEKISKLDHRILDRLQNDIPFSKRPWSIIAKDLAIDEALLIKRIRLLKEDGIIRRISATFNPRKVGFASTLVAVIVSPKKINQVAKQLNSYPEITHNYKRNSEFNLWFTLVANSRRRILDIIEEVKQNKDIENVLELPAIRIFKINVNFSKKT